MPINYKDYPANWPALRQEILDRAGGRCEGSPAFPDCRAENYQPHPVTGSRVVLTVAHMDHDRNNHDPANLRALCQRCHLTHDALQHVQTRRRNKHRNEVIELILKNQELEEERGRLFTIIKELQADIVRLERERGTP